MTTNKHDLSDNPDPGPLALHIRFQRQQFGDRGISQADLAHLTGLTARTLQKYEDLRRLPPVVDVLLRVARGLRLHIEDLLDPRHLAALDAEVAERRRALAGDADEQAIGFRCRDHAQG